MSINSFCEKNGVPYEEFDKWFRKTHQSVGRVEIENIPDDEPTLKSSRRRGRKAEPYRFVQVKFSGDGERAYRIDWKDLVAVLQAPVIKTLRIS